MRNNNIVSINLKKDEILIKLNEKAEQINKQEIFLTIISDTE